MLLIGSLSILVRQGSYPVILRKILTEPQVHHYSFSFFSGGFKSSFVDHILSSFQMFFMLVHLIFNHFSLFNCSEVLKISQKIRFHSQSIQVISRLLPYSGHLMQPVQSPPFNQSFNDVLFRVGPNPQVFSQDLT